MGYTDQRLFRARALEPIAGIGDVLFLLDQKGPLFKAPFWFIKGIEPVFGLGPHGLMIIWSQAAAGAAGYGTAVGSQALPDQAATGNIAAGAYVDINNSKLLQQGPQQLFQMRFALRPLALTGAVKEQDLELQVYLPGSAGKFGILGASPGYYNMVDQLQDPADAVDSPAQNANQALPAVFPAVHSRDQNNLTEMFVWEINAPRFRLWNNGGATITAGLVGLRIWGFRYDLEPLFPDGTWVNRWIYGGLQKAPPIDRAIPVVQTAVYTGQGTF
jgi:hypothetical protein